MNQSFDWFFFVNITYSIIMMYFGESDEENIKRIIRF